MKWPWFTINWMGRQNDAYRLWLDIKIGRFWYVFIWRRGYRPYLYRSTDATPPADDNEGRWFLRSRGYYD